MFFSSFNTFGSNLVRHTQPILKYYYKCDALSGVNLYNEVTSSYDTGTVGSCSLSVDKIAGTGSLSIPSSSYINMAGKLDFSAGSGIYSLSMWFRTTNTTDNVPLAIFSSSSNVADQTLIELTGQSTITEYTGSNSVALAAPVATNLKDGSWYHIVWAGFGNNSGTRAVYIDGTIWGSGSYTSSVFNANATGTNSCIGKLLNGNVDDIQIYSGTLNVEQANTLYNNGAGGGTV